MLKLSASLALSLAAALSVASVTTTSAASNQQPTPSDKVSTVGNHIPEIDGPIITLTGPDGHMWTAWSYRALHEFDIAISSRDASTTTWEAPVFLGRGNGSDDVDPALAVDSRGAVYLAFATTNPPRVAVATLAPGSNTWTEPVIVSGAETATSPALLVAGDRLIIAFRTARGVGLVQIPTLGNENKGDGLGDGPEPIGPAVKGAPVRPSGPTWDRSNLP